MEDSLDATEARTFAAVGLALTRWEVMEAGLADLHSVLRGQPFDKQVVVEFGQRHSTTTSRIAGVVISADRYFSRWPDQEREGELRRLLTAVAERALDRHRIAHGLVDLVHFGTASGGVVSGHALVAPWYAETRLKMGVNDAWPSAAVTNASDRFVELNRRITTFINLLFADHR